MKDSYDKHPLGLWKIEDHMPSYLKSTHAVMD